MNTKKTTKLILERLENLLVEGRVEDVKNKYPQPMWGEVDKLIDIDPSNNNKYLEWMAKNFLQRTIDWFKKNASATASGGYYGEYTLDQVPNTSIDPRWETDRNLQRRMGGVSEDMDVLRDSLEHFHKNPSKYQIKDINAFTSSQDFYDAVEIAKQQLSRKEQKETGIDKVYEDENFVLMMPKTHKASCRYGANTRWCVTMRNYSGYFENYFGQGPIFFLIDKRRTPRSYSPTYMQHAPDYWKVALHYRPFNGRLDRDGKRALEYARKLSKEEFLDGANVGNVHIDYWNVQDQNKKESVVAKYLGGPGKGQTLRSDIILNNLKAAMETYTKKWMADFYDNLGDDSSVVEKVNKLKEEINKTNDERSSAYNKMSRLQNVINNLESFGNRLQSDEGDDQYREWVTEQLEKARKFYRQLDDLYRELNNKSNELQEELSKIQEKLSKKGLVFYDREKNQSLTR